jgi:hypothetical protein
MPSDRIAWNGIIILAIFLFLELLSWETASWPSPCLVVNSQQHQSATSDNKQQTCPTFFVGSLILLGRADKFIEHHDKSIVAVFTVVLAISTIGLWLATNRLWKAGERQMELVERNAVQHSGDMQASITEATRAASAMEDVAKAAAESAKLAAENVITIRERTAAQMRAYISVSIGTAVYQDREKELKFEAKPILINFGHTPAYNVTFNSRAKILPFPLPDDFDFPLSGDPGGVGVLGPQQQFILNAIVDDFVDNREIEDIKIMKGKALFIWGIITYRDAFGAGRETKFCHHMIWHPNGQIGGYYNKRHNEAT